MPTHRLVRAGVIATEALCNPAWQMQDKYATMHRLVTNSLIHVEIRVEVAERENRNV